MFKRLSYAALTVASLPLTAKATILPPNDLHKEDCLACERNANGGEVEFNAIVDKAQRIFAPIVAQHGAKLTIEKRFSDSTVNAFASQPSPTDWRVAMFGGLFRRPEVTADGFALVVCHELGHHLGGFAFYEGNGEFAASEGQSDYYATQACARRMFAGQDALNQRFKAQLPSFLAANCDNRFSVQTERGICYRSMAAGQSLANLLAALNTNAKPNPATPDTRVVRETFTSHPQAQCRLDTYIAGALCRRPFNLNEIPGKDHPDGQQSFGAQQEAFAVSCRQGTFRLGFRPRCWFAPVLNSVVFGE